jgi:hypothetical protein
MVIVCLASPLFVADMRRGAVVVRDTLTGDRGLGFSNVLPQLSSASKCIAAQCRQRHGQPLSVNVNVTPNFSSYCVPLSVSRSKPLGR